MKTLHQKNTAGSYLETLCGKTLGDDVRRRDDVLLATLELEQEDVDLNFGSDAEICITCLDKGTTTLAEVLAIHPLVS